MEEARGRKEAMKYYRHPAVPMSYKERGWGKPSTRAAETKALGDRYLGPVPKSDLGPPLSGEGSYFGGQDKDLSGTYIGTQKDLQGLADTAGMAVGTAGAAAGAYHGYKRTGSVGWAIGWALLGGMFPVITIPVALAQGFGKKKR
jgi:hypothetical protein